MSVNLSDVLGKTYSFDYERRMSFQKVRLFDYALQFDIPELLHVDLGLQAYRIKGGIITHWIEQEKFEVFYSAAKEFFCSASFSEKINELADFIESSLVDLETFSDERADYSALSNQTLAESYTEFCELEKRTSLMNQLLFIYFEKSVTNALLDTLGKNAKEVIEVLSLQTEPIPSDVYQKDLYRYILGTIEWDELSRKYVHLGMMDVIDSLRSIEEMREDIEHARKGDPEVMIADMDRMYRERRVAVEKAVAKMGTDRHIRSLIRFYTVYSNKKEYA